MCTKNSAQLSFNYISAEHISDEFRENVGELSFEVDFLSAIKVPLKVSFAKHLSWSWATVKEGNRL